MIFHRIALVILYALTLVCLVYLTYNGLEYYHLAQTERPHHSLHTELKPGGFTGHGTGVIGSLMMMLLLLYSVRKRARFMHGKGNIRYWLNYHIWLGITGPLLVIFHSSFKIQGIIAISFWSMIAVALSGVFGRFLYLQIPRTESGDDLSASETRQLEKNLSLRLKEDYKLDEKTIGSLLAQINPGTGKNQMSLLTLLIWLFNDIKTPVIILKLKKQLKTEFGLSKTQIKNIISLAHKLAVLKRRILFLGKTRQLLHHWHIIHRPFAAVMLIIMLIHTVVAVLFGYKWIF